MLKQKNAFYIFIRSILLSLLIYIWSGENVMTYNRNIKHRNNLSFYIYNNNIYDSKHVYNIYKKEIKKQKNCYIKKIKNQHFLEHINNNTDSNEYLLNKNDLLKHLEILSQQFLEKKLQPFEKVPEERNNINNDENINKNKNKNNFSINNLYHYIQSTHPSGLQNIKFIYQDRKKYTFTKNKISDDFLNTEQVPIESNLLKKYTKDEDQKNCHTQKDITRNDIHNNIQSNNNMCNDLSNNSILCMTTNKYIPRDQKICSIPNNYIINYENIIQEIQMFVDHFNNYYKVNYLKYIFKNNIEDEINKLDSITILLYDIYIKHNSFLNFIKYYNSSSIYLKYWDIKLTLIITYIHFISKYINTLLYIYNFNNSLFTLLHKYYIDHTQKKKKNCHTTHSNNYNQNGDTNHLSNHNKNVRNNEKIIYIEENINIKQHDELNKNNISNIYNINDLYIKYNYNNYIQNKIDSMYNSSSFINNIHSFIKSKTSEILKNHSNFFFYKNYEHYIQYIVNKEELNHLPLYYKDSSFYLFNNNNIKNIILYRKQMIHEFIKMCTSQENFNEPYFHFIDKNIIHKILFTNNKFFIQLHKIINTNINTNQQQKNYTHHFETPTLKQQQKLNINTLYNYIMLSFYENDNIKDDNKNGDNKNGDNKNVDETYNHNSDNNHHHNNNISCEENIDINIYSNESLEKLKELIKNTINDVAYNNSIFNSFENIFNYHFVMHIYSYVSTHAIKMKSSLNLYTSNNDTNNSMQNNMKKKYDTQNNENIYKLKDNIINSSIKMKDEEKTIEELYIKECSDFNFNEYEQKEKQNENKNKNMCLIPIIDVCNHSSLSNNSTINKEDLTVTYDNVNNKICQHDEDYLKNIQQYQYNEEIDDSVKNVVNQEDSLSFYSEKKKKKKNYIDHNDNNDIISTNNTNDNNKTNHNNMNPLLIPSSIIHKIQSVHLISSKNIEEGEEITVSYGNANNDLLLLEYGFIEKEKETKVYFNFDIKIIREIIIQILGVDKLPLIMLDSLEQVKVNLFKQLNIIDDNQSVYQRFDTKNLESAHITRKKKEIFNDYLRKNTYFNEYNIFTMKDRINKFFIDEKLQHDSRKKNKKNYLYIGSNHIVDPILLATIRIIIYDDINQLSKININQLTSWNHYLSIDSEMVVIQILIKLIDEIIYEHFSHINYEYILKQGFIKYEDLKFLHNKFLQINTLHSHKSINLLEYNNFFITIYNILKIKELKNAKDKLNQKFNQMKHLFNEQNKNENIIK
ncbi:hypothetical protein PGSY75_1304600 [Plasmodium gaboni]|uniref:SET domain-containing protein n=1 Tax=Plasmodium gaboni TaxID=647221 RepID=A0A151LD37_9APIC|nr:hypothetical protein PGSY75_1304600 [Plasmodium gaboni]KYN96849.1 hypothetical protein PGSY75_1304600 [Plasmodium gaboni]